MNRLPRARLSPRPLVALLTDFGYSDWYVAVIKALILSACPDAEIIDISHNIEPQNVKHASLVLECVFESFPADTVFLAIVDPGVGTEREPVIVNAGNWIFVGPNNGLFGFLDSRFSDTTCRIIQIDDRRVISPTFHGRDVFAPCVGAIAAGRSIKELAPVKTRLVARADADAGDTNRIVYFDHFGNAVTSIQSAEIRSATSVRLMTAEGIIIAPLHRTYADVAKAGLLAYAGSAGRVEIGINHGNARIKLKLCVGDVVHLIDN